MPASVTPSRRCSGSAASLSSSTARLAACSSGVSITRGIVDICTAGRDRDKHEHRVAAAERRGAVRGEAQRGGP
eukprot:scaffold104844_cov54-Phaeocystis_antarctica.AAC.2